MIRNSPLAPLLVTGACIWWIGCAHGPRFWNHADKVVGSVHFYTVTESKQLEKEIEQTRITFFLNGWVEMVDSANIDPMYLWKHPCHQLSESDHEAALAAWSGVSEWPPEPRRLSDVTAMVLVENTRYYLIGADAIADYPEVERLIRTTILMGLEQFPKRFGERIRAHPLALLVDEAELDRTYNPSARRPCRGGSSPPLTLTAPGPRNGPAVVR